MNNMFSSSKVVAFLLMRVQYNNQAAKAFTIAQLSEHKRERLIPANKLLDIPITIMLLVDTEKFIFTQETLPF